MGQYQSSPTILFPSPQKIDKHFSLNDEETTIDRSQSNKFTLIKKLQSILFSLNSDQNLIRSTIEEIKDELSPQEIDHQLILAFSLDYQRIPILAPLLSSSDISYSLIFHLDQDFLFYLLQANVTPFISNFISHITPYRYTEDSSNQMKDQTNFNFLNYYSPFYYLNQQVALEQNLCEMLKKISPQSLPENYILREKKEIEIAIETDNLETLRVLSNSSTFNFNAKIIKDNQLYHYIEIPYLSFSIEKNAMKCFKYLFLNGSDPTQKSLFSGNQIPMWDSYGFAGSCANLQIIRMIEDSGYPPSADLMKGCVQFHKNHLLLWIFENHPKLLKFGLKYSLYYENYEALDFLIQNNISADLTETDPISCLLRSSYARYSHYLPSVYETAFDIAVQKELFTYLIPFLNQGIQSHYYQLEKFFDFISSCERVPLTEEDVIKIKAGQPANNGRIEFLNNCAISSPRFFTILRKNGSQKNFYDPSPYISLEGTQLLVGNDQERFLINNNRDRMSKDEVMDYSDGEEEDEEASSPFGMDWYDDDCSPGAFNYLSGNRKSSHYPLNMDFIGSSGQLFLPNLLTIYDNLIFLFTFKTFKNFIQTNEFSNSSKIIGYIIDDDVYFGGVCIGKIPFVFTKCDLKFPDDDNGSRTIYSFSDDFAADHNGKSSLLFTMYPMIPFDDPSRCVMIIRDFGISIGIKINNLYRRITHERISKNEALRISSILSLEMNKIEDQSKKTLWFAHPLPEQNQKLRAELANALKDYFNQADSFFDARDDYYFEDYNNESKWDYTQSKKYKDFVNEFENLRTTLEQQIEGKNLEEQNQILINQIQLVLDKHLAYLKENPFYPECTWA